MTELEAVNIVLVAAGVKPVNDLDTESLNANRALPVLDQARKSILKRGYGFNTDTKTFTPDINDRIAVPSSYFDIKAPSSLREKLTVRNGYLWDRTTQEYWAEAVELQVVQDLSFEQIKEPWAEYIARVAAVNFENQVNGQVSALNVRQMDMAKIAAHNSENEKATTNGFSQFISILGAYTA